MANINIVNLTFGYDCSYENVFENVNLCIDGGWRLGLTGRNGRGKTTLLRLLCGELEYSGTISSGLDFEYFPYQILDNDAFTADVISEIAPAAENWQIVKELSMLEVREEVLWRAFSTLSCGEQTKVLLAAMFLRENSFLLIDEPTNHLDAYARDVLCQYLKRKSGFILVSHDRAFLDGCIDHIIAINKTNIEVQSGNFSSWQENKERRDSFEAAENVKLQKEIKQLTAAAEKAARHSEKIAATKIGIDPIKTEKSLTRRDSVAKKSRKLINRAKAMENRIERDINEKSALLHNVEFTGALKLSPLEYRSSKLASFLSVSAGYGDGNIFENLSFDICRGDRIALCGGNGCGKSTVIKLLMGENIPHSGEVYVGGGLIISYVSQSAEGLRGTITEFAAEKVIDESLFRAILCKLDFSPELFSRPIETYSQGQRKKAALAASLSQKAHLYVWDEPLNYIDVISRIQLERLINDAKPTLLFVEHDRAFCGNTATKEIVIA